jgi:hypothetical protein
MFHIHRFSVKNLLQQTGNNLTIAFLSTAAYAKQQKDA